MNVIVDNMVVSRVLVADDDSVFLPIREKIMVDKALKLVYGGKLLREYARSRDVMRMVHRLDQAGRAMVYEDSRIDARAAEIKKLCLCISNDVHIIALAQESGARLLCTEDYNLQLDFGNPALIQRPRGRVYKKATRAHRELLEDYCRACRHRQAC